MYKKFSVVMFLIPFLALCVSEVVSVPLIKQNDTLVLLHVILRHGDRTPDLHEMYPKDPYQSEIYFPEGLGELTKAGKKREYELGKALRNRYSAFLGDYKSSRVSAMSTDYVRTKMSCLLVLAGLYPPNDKQVWNSEIPWQPIPYSHNKNDSDSLLGEPVYVCPTFIKEYNQYLAKEGDKIYDKNKKLFEYVSYHSGVTIKVPRQIYDLQFLLNAEEAMGLELPAWTKSVWPNNITKVAVDEYYLTFATPLMRRLAAGPLLKKIIDDTKAKIAPNSTDERKIYIYSAHENNVAYPLILFDAFYPHIPPYGSYIVMEVHKFNNVYGLKVYYENYSDKSGYIDIAHCGIFCPFEKFVELMKDNLPFADDAC